VRIKNNQINGYAKPLINLADFNIDVRIRQDKNLDINFRFIKEVNGTLTHREGSHILMRQY
jgi:hypothetical protein